jgi:hypothetical protein
MASEDLHNRVFIDNALSSTAIGSNTTTSGATVNTFPDICYESLEFVIRSTAYTDGTYTPNIQDSPDGTNWTNVDNSFLIPDDGTAESGAVINANNQIKRLGYVGKQQFVRLQIVSTSVTTGATLNAVAVLSHASNLPTTAN